MLQVCRLVKIYLLLLSDLSTLWVYWLVKIYLLFTLCIL
jgi:hypothetical protein